MNPQLQEWLRCGISLSVDGPQTCVFDLFAPEPPEPLESIVCWGPSNAGGL